MTVNAENNFLKKTLVILLISCAPSFGQNSGSTISEATKSEMISVLDYPKGIQEQILTRPDNKYRFLHDCVIANHKNVLYAAWYNCPDGEIEDESVIRGRYSVDKGKTWSEIRYFARDSTNKLMYVPPAFGVINGALYMYVSRMTGHDQVKDILLFKLNEKKKNFIKVDSIPIPFIINTSVTLMENGKLIAGGRRSEVPGTLPLIPAVLISDNGSALGPWRVIDIQKDSKNPDGTPFEYPETGLITRGAEITAIVRGEQQNPLVYKSPDFGTTWSLSNEINFPFAGASKITCGVLSDGRDYVIGNVQGFGRNKLIIGFRNKGSETFSKAYLLQDGENTKLNASPEWSYPSACELENKLYVIYTSGKKASALSIIPLANVKK